MMRTQLLDVLRAFTRRLGWDLVPYNAEQHAILRRQRLLEHHGVDLVLDVGANVGQFGLELRRAGYKGRIVSFEPLGDAFAALEAVSRGDPQWQVVHTALGAQRGTQTMHRAANSESSSLLNMLPLHVQAAPRARYEGAETVCIETLDGLYDELCAGAKNVYLKIDTQGYESQVLDGATRSLRHIDTVQLELSLVPLYEGQSLIDDLRHRLRAEGFELVALDSSFADARTGHVLQVDGVFRRERTR
jgi:FkbM family methyltransferase